MALSTFFKLFPPPEFLNSPYAGISISDDAIQCIQFSGGARGKVITKYANKPIPTGIVEAGHIMDEPRLTEILKALVKELGISFVKASLPEEKVYLFKTIVPAGDSASISQYIEFKLEENVPLSAADALFCFEIIPGTLVDGKHTVSVLVSPRKAVDAYLQVLTDAGLHVLSFEMTAQALARSLIEKDSIKTSIIVDLMEHKAGVYVIHEDIVCFSSTVQLGGDAVSSVHAEVAKVYDYWNLHGEGKKEIDTIIFCGKPALIPQISESILSILVDVEPADVWKNSLFAKDYIPAITFQDSLEYAVAAGLAISSEHP